MKQIPNADDAVRKVIKTIEALEVSHTDITSPYDQWMNIGFAFANELGEQGRDLFHRVSRMHPQYDDNECDRKYNNALATQNGRVRLATFFHYAQQAGITIPRGERKANQGGRARKTDDERRQEAKNRTEKVLEAIRDMGTLRYNLITEQVEIRWNSLPDEWKPLEPRILRLLFKRLNQQGIAVSEGQLASYIDNDDMSLPYNPAEEYARSLPAWDGQTDHIDRLFAHLHLTTDDDEAQFLRHMAKKWYVTMVAVAIEHRNVQNQLMLLLFSETGGTGKTEFVKRLLPHPLQRYTVGQTTLDNRENKDEMMALANNILYNLDEFVFNTTNYNRIKNMVGGAAGGTTNLRRAYDRTAKVRRTHVSFIGTTNQLNMLPDNAGSRRFVVLPISGSDDYATLPVDEAFAQAYALIRQGTYPLAVTRDEMRKLETINCRYVEQDTAEAILHTVVRCPEPHETCLSVTVGEIIEWMKQVAPGNYSAKSVGTLLRKNNFQCKKVNGKIRYKIMKLNFAALEDEAKTIAAEWDNHAESA